MNLVFRLPGEAIDRRHACCLGSQLAQIVALLSNSLGHVTWYVIDVDAIGDTFQPFLERVSLVGGSQQLVERVQQVDQFLSGVFLAVKAEVSKPRFRKDIDTEDPVDADLGSAIVEIRAFDTSYFELLTRDKAIADFVEKTFGVPADSV